MFAIFLLELVLVLTIVGAIIMVIANAVKFIKGNSVLSKEVQRKEDETSSLNRKISELMTKRKEFEDLRKEFDVTQELAEIDLKLTGLRSQLAAVEGRQVADPADQ